MELLSNVYICPPFAKCLQTYQQQNNMNNSYFNNNHIIINFTDLKLHDLKLLPSQCPDFIVLNSFYPLFSLFIIIHFSCLLFFFYSVYYLSIIIIFYYYLSMLIPVLCLLQSFQVGYHFGMFLLFT